LQIQNYQQLGVGLLHGRLLLLHLHHHRSSVMGICIILS
jgi:hypothetical protein